MEPEAAEPRDIGAYCRQVEDHLAKVNGGHLIRVVGPGFELVRTWARLGIPTSVVCYGISQKAERHRLGPSRRPLRLEFCEADVQAAYERWRRAVGLVEVVPADGSGNLVSSGALGKKPSLAKHLERVVDKLSRVVGRLDLAAEFRDAVGQGLRGVTEIAERVRHLRGAERDEATVRLESLDAAMLAAARAAVGDADMLRLRQEAIDELHAYRGRLGPEQWERSVQLGIDRLLRDRLGLPVIVP